MSAGVVINFVAGASRCVAFLNAGASRCLLLGWCRK